MAQHYPTATDPYAWIDADLATIHRAGWYRAPRPAVAAGPIVEIEGQPLVQFASNDYLGLAADPRPGQAAAGAALAAGSGVTGSRLLSGDRLLHHALEAALADWKGCEASLLFSSGFLANLGTIPALVGRRDLVLQDARNHASLRAGAELSGAHQLTWADGTPNTLAHLLAHHRSNHRRCLICTDGVFSMDGDLAHLDRIAELAVDYSCMLLVDDAHGSGVLGPAGAGSVAHYGLHLPLIQVGTLSKALASLGGFVAGSHHLIDYLRNRARTWIYTTGLSPADTAAALTALTIARSDDDRRARLWRNVEHLRRGALGLGVEVLPSDSAILCLRVGDLTRTLQVADRLRAAGYFAPAIRPPTVPTSRIRFSVMATHTSAQIDGLLAALAAALAPGPV